PGPGHHLLLDKAALQELPYTSAAASPNLDTCRAPMPCRARIEKRRGDAFARFLGLPREKVRPIYLESSSCYGMDGHGGAEKDTIAVTAASKRSVGPTSRGMLST